MAADEVQNTCPKCGSSNINRSNPFGSAFCEDCGWIDSASPMGVTFREGLRYLIRWFSIAGLMAFFLALFVQFFVWKQYSFAASFLQLKSLFSRDKVSANLELGTICNTLDNLNCSIKYFNKVVNKDPKNKSALANLGMALAGTSQWKKAEPVLEGYFSLGGDSFDVVYWYGRTLYELGRPEKGVDWYYYSLKLNSSYRKASDTLLNLFMKKNDVAGALSLIGAITRGQPENIKYWQRMLDSKKFLKQKDVAKSDINWFIPSLDGIHFYVSTILKDNSRIRYFSINQQRDQNTLSMDTMDELLLNVPKSVKKVKVTIDDIDQDAVEFVLDNVRIGGWREPHLTVVACRKCPNELGNSFLKQFHIEKWTEFKTDFLLVNSR